MKITRKQRAALGAALALALALTACAPAEEPGPSSTLEAPPASSVPESQAAPPSVPQTPEAGVDDAQHPTRLTMYADIEDVPGAAYSITELETEYDRPGEITKDGAPFLAPPGPSVFANPVFADSRYLYVRAEWPDGDFQWYFFDWELADPNAEITLPDSMGKMFTGADGSLLVCDDGTAFDTEAWQWVTH